VLKEIIITQFLTHLIYMLINYCYKTEKVEAVLS